jgi:hypothetical protein
MEWMKKLIIIYYKINPIIIYFFMIKLGIRNMFKYSNNQKRSSWGLTPLVKVNLVLKYPPKFSTFLIFATRLASTVCWTFFA